MVLVCFLFPILHLALMAFMNWRAQEDLVVANEDDRVFMSRNYQSDSYPLEI